MKNNEASSLEVILKDDGLHEISKELIEIGIDSFLEEGILKDIPIAGTVHSLLKASRTITDKLFAKKIIFFLNSLDEVSAKDREEMINEINQSEDYKIQVGKKILFILDRADDHEKAAWVGTLFNAFLHREISYKEFLLSSKIINSVERYIFTSFLNLSEDHMKVINYVLSDYSDFYWSLINAGLYSLNIESVSEKVTYIGGVNVKQTMHLTKIGFKMHKVFNN